MSIAVAVALMLFGVAGTASRASAQPLTFADVSASTGYATQIQWLAEQGISTGWPQPDGSRLYKPLDPVHRDAMAAFLYRLAGSPAYTPPDRSPFTDVTPSTAYYTQICWLVSRGIANGWSDHTYRPLDNVNRDAMAAFMYRFDGSPSFTAPARSPFTDVTSTSQFYTEMSWMRTMGISTGWPDGSYRPLSPVARDAMAAFMYRLHGIDATTGTINIPDPGLLQCIDRQLGIPAGTAVGAAQAASLTSLVCDGSTDGYPISNIDGIQSLINLNELDLNSNQISDLTPLAGLGQLTDLLLMNNQISDLTPLAGLGKLALVVLDTNNVSNITPIKALVDRGDVSLAGNPICSTAPSTNGCTV